LVLSDLLYPGWHAMLDDEATPLYATNGLFRGVIVPAGAHRVEMRYFPQSLRWGLGLMAMALFILCAFLARAARQKRTPSLFLKNAGS